jgi:hypothetical protein
MTCEWKKKQSFSWHTDVTQDYAKNTASCVNVAVFRPRIFLGQVCGIRAELPSNISECQLTF